MKWRERLRWRLRRVKYRWVHQWSHFCLDCGFLTVSGREADADDRRTIAAEGKVGWFGKDVNIDCYKHLWYWDGDPASVVIHEANRPRSRCVGFRRHKPGRSPQQHIALEDEGSAFRKQVLLALLPFVGALAGALIGAWVSLRHH